MTTASVIAILVASLVFQVVEKSYEKKKEGPVSAVHEEPKGANGPSEHVCDQCSGRE